MYNLNDDQIKHLRNILNKQNIELLRHISIYNTKFLDILDHMLKVHLIKKEDIFHLLRKEPDEYISKIFNKAFSKSLVNLANLNKGKDRSIRSGEEQDNVVKSSISKTDDITVSQKQSLPKEKTVSGINLNSDEAKVMQSHEIKSNQSYKSTKKYSVTSNSENEKDKRHLLDYKDDLIASPPEEINVSEMIDADRIKHKGVNPDEKDTMLKRIPILGNKNNKEKVLPSYRLKNGKVGEEYSDTLDLDELYDGNEITEYTIEGLEDIGVKLDQETMLIKGIPAIAGDPKENFEFDLTVRFTTGNGEKIKRKIFIKILPDPRKMWKELEPPESIGDRQPHEDKGIIKIKSGEKGKEKVLFCASKRGRSHAHKSLFRDDNVRIKYLSDTGWSIMVVADGAGSAKLSRVGSKIACEKSIEFVSNSLKEKNEGLIDAINNNNKTLDDDQADNSASNTMEGQNNAIDTLLNSILVKAALEAYEAIDKEADKRRTKINEFSTTMLLAIHKKVESSDFFAGIWIGDGALAIYMPSKVILLGQPDSGEYSGETVFMTMGSIMQPEELAKRVRYEIVDEFTALMAMTDGVSDPKFGTDSNLEDPVFWDKLWHEIKSEVISTEDQQDEKLLSWLDFWVEGEHDDRTIAILY